MRQKIFNAYFERGIDSCVRNEILNIYFARIYIFMSKNFQVHDFKKLL